MKVYSINQVDKEHLEAVKTEMVNLGAPKIQVVDCGDYYQSLEGSHRLAAAAALGLTPEFIVLDQYDEIDITGYDWYENDYANWAEEKYLAGEVAGELFNVNADIYEFDV